MPATITDVSNTVKLLNRYLDGLRRPLQVQIATVIQRLQANGYGEVELIGAMVSANVWENPVYRNSPVSAEAIDKLSHIVRANACTIGHELTVQAVHYSFSNRGIVV